MLKRRKTGDAQPTADAKSKGGGLFKRGGSQTKPTGQPQLYGVVAEFDNEEDLVKAAHHAYEAGYRRMDAFTPYPIEEVSEAIGFHHNRVALIVLIGGLTGVIAGFLLQYYIMVIDYPLNFNGRAPFAWPAFVPVMFETTILGSAFAAVLGMLALNGLPLLYHPVMKTPGFERVTRDGYFFAIEAADPAFDSAKVRQFFQEQRARNIAEVNV
jgi:hypothetical protein